MHLYDTAKIRKYKRNYAFYLGKFQEWKEKEERKANKGKMVFFKKKSAIKSFLAG